MCSLVSYDTGASAYPYLPVSDECSDKLSELRSEQAEAERTTRSRTTDGGCRISHRKRFYMPPCSMKYYGIGEMLAPNHKGRRASGGSHGDDTDADGACLTGPQPYIGEKTRVSPVCCRFPLSAGWNLKRHARRKSDGRIPRLSGRGGGQSGYTSIDVLPPSPIHLNQLDPCTCSGYFLPPATASSNSGCR